MTFCVKVPPTVLTPMIVVGLMSSMAATKLALQDLVTHLDDEVVPLLVEAFAVEVGISSALLQDGVGVDHFAGHEI
jgi:hypothetical protein